MSDLLIKRLRGQRLDGRSPVDCMVDAADEIESLRARLAEVRGQGFAESRGAFQAEVHSIAVPLFDALGRCTGAVAVAALASRMSEDQRRLIRFALASAGSEITSLWGGTLPADIATLWRLAA